MPHWVLIFAHITWARCVCDCAQLWGNQNDTAGKKTLEFLHGYFLNLSHLILFTICSEKTRRTSPILHHGNVVFRALCAGPGVGRGKTVWTDWAGGQRRWTCVKASWDDESQSRWLICFYRSVLTQMSVWNHHRKQKVLGWGSEFLEG